MTNKLDNKWIELPTYRNVDQARRAYAAAHPVLKTAREQAFAENARRWLDELLRARPESTKRHVLRHIALELQAGGHYSFRSSPAVVEHAVLNQLFKRFSCLNPMWDMASVPYENWTCFVEDVAGASYFTTPYSQVPSAR